MNRQTALHRAQPASAQIVIILVASIAVFIVGAVFLRHTKPAFPMFCRLEAEVESALYLTELQNDPSSTVDGPLNRVVSPPFSRRGGRVIKTMSPSELARPGVASICNPESCLTTRLRPLRWPRSIFLMGAAPLLERRGLRTRFQISSIHLQRL